MGSNTFLSQGKKEAYIDKVLLFASGAALASSLHIGAPKAITLAREYTAAISFLCALQNEVICAKIAGTFADLMKAERKDELNGIHRTLDLQDHPKKRKR